MIWVKTDAGRAEIQARALVKERAQRNLLLLIDGKATSEKLLAGVAGISAADFATLQSLGLITVLSAPPPPPPPPPPRPSAPAAFSGKVDIDVSGLDYATLRGAIGRMISKELGMRGLAMSMILEESLTVDDLKGVAERLLKMIADRKGAAVAAEAQRTLFGR